MEALLRDYDQLTRTIGPNYHQLSDQRREHERIARTPAHRKGLLEKRVAIAKRAKAILADPEWKKKLAVADSAIEAARKELTEAEKPFKRLEAAKAGLHNVQSARAGVEAGRRTALLTLSREADQSHDYVWSDVCAELQSALDAAMGSRSCTEKVRENLKAALKTASELPYRFTGSWSRWESLLTSLRSLAQSRGGEAENSEKWDSPDIFGPVELDGAGR